MNPTHRVYITMIFAKPPYADTLRQAQQSVSFINSVLKYCSQKSPSFTDLYLFVIEKMYDVLPVSFAHTKTIYMNVIDARQNILADGIISKITIQVTDTISAVDAETSKIYICPFSGRIVGNNMFLHPEDEICSWVASRPENVIGASGVPKKRFFISTDKDLIRSYMTENTSKVKTVYKATSDGMLFLSEHNAIEHIISSLGHMPIKTVLNQNKFAMSENLLNICQLILNETHIQNVSNMLNDIPELSSLKYIWAQE